jgi:hypothetical protein
MHHGIIHVQSEQPNFSGIPEKKHDWLCIHCHDAEELLPTDALAHRQRENTT